MKNESNQTLGVNSTNTRFITRKIYTKRMESRCTINANKTEKETRSTCKNLQLVVEIQTQQGVPARIRKPTKN